MPSARGAGTMHYFETNFVLHLPLLTCIEERSRYVVTYTPGNSTCAHAQEYPIFILSRAHVKADVHDGRLVRLVIRSAPHMHILVWHTFTGYQLI
jgi:hypothetical protein